MEARGAGPAVKEDVGKARPGLAAIAGGGNAQQLRKDPPVRCVDADESVCMYVCVCV